jgi:hypothetical protein
LKPLVDGIGDAIDAAGGDFTMGYAAVVITAGLERTSSAR